MTLSDLSRKLLLSNCYVLCWDAEANWTALGIGSSQSPNVGASEQCWATGMHRGLWERGVVVLGGEAMLNQPGRSGQASWR